MYVYGKGIMFIYVCMYKYVYVYVLYVNMYSYVYLCIPTYQLLEWIIFQFIAASTFNEILDVIERAVGTIDELENSH